MGFNDGCQTFTGIMAGGWQRTLPHRVDGWKLTGKNPKDPSRPHPTINTKEKLEIYQNAFDEGMEHCTYEYDWWVL